MRRINALAKLPLLFLSALALSACGGETVPEHEHQWDEGTVTVVPNCHETGTMTYKCTVAKCKQTMLKTLEMTPHNWDAGVITKPATCAETGEQTFTCQNDGCDQVKVVTVPKGEHHYEEVGLTRTPDLFEDGEMGYRCSECGHESGQTVHARADFAEQFASDNWSVGYLASFDPSATSLAATVVPFDAEKQVYEDAHVTVSENTIDLKDGALLLSYRVQTDAENSINLDASFLGLTATDKLAAMALVLDSLGNVKSAVAVSELAASWDYEQEAVVDVTSDDILALVYYGGAAAGEFSLTWSPKCVHVFDQGHVKTPSTCSTEGVYEYTCIVCGQTKTRPIAKGEHVWGEGEVITPATEESEGVMRYTCDECGETKDEPIPMLRHRIASFYEDFSTTGATPWKYGYSSDYNFLDNTFEFTALEGAGEEYNSEDGIIIKKDWLCTEAEGKDLAVSYAVPDGKDEITVEIAFQGTDESTRLSARLLQLGQDGTLKNLHFFAEGAENAAWEGSLDLTAENGDVLYLILFRESGSWPQGRLDIDIYGPKDAESSGGYVDLQADGVVRNEIDTSTGVAGNVWANEWGAHLKVETACSQDWPARMFISTGVTLSEGHRYLVSMDIAKDEGMRFNLILANQYWDGHEYAFDGSGKTGFRSFEIAVPAGKGGELFVKVQCGLDEGEVTLNNLFVKELGEAVPLVMDSTVFNEIDTAAGVAGNVWANEWGAHLKVETACSQDWPARMFIKTGVTLTAGEKYYVGMDLSKDAEVPFTLILANQYWDGFEFHYQNDGEAGHLGFEISVPEGKGGELFVKVQCGLDKVEITVDNIRVLKK